MTSPPADPNEEYSVSLRTVNGWAILPSSIQSAGGKPRFEMFFPSYRIDDLGAKALVQTETTAGIGYELPTRNLIEKVLRAGDLFIDVGAHWGYFTLQAATHPAGNIRVMAIEPDPENAGILYQNLIHNQVQRSAFLVCAACGQDLDLAPLVSNSSMGHSIRAAGLQGGVTQGTPKFVMVVTIDSVMPVFPHLAGGRVILKIDAEGYETKVMAGAQKLLDSGRVALITWELGRAFADGSERAGIIAMVDSLTRRGFRHFRPPEHHTEGALMPFNPNDEYILCNVFSFGPGLEIPG